MLQHRPPPLCKATNSGLLPKFPGTSKSSKSRKYATQTHCEVGQTLEPSNSVRAPSNVGEASHRPPLDINWRGCPDPPPGSSGGPRASSCSASRCASSGLVPGRGLLRLLLREAMTSYQVPPVSQPRGTSASGHASFCLSSAAGPEPCLPAVARPSSLHSPHSADVRTSPHVS